MAGIKERLIQVVLRGKDELSAEAAKGAEALDELRAVGEELQDSLGKAEGAARLADQLDNTRTMAERAQKAYNKAQEEVEALRRELDAAPSSKGIEAALKGAQQNSREAAREVRKLTAELEKSPGDAGVTAALRQAERYADEAGAEVKRLREELDSVPTNTRLNQSLKEAERNARALGREQDRLREAESLLADAAQAAGIDTARLTVEQQRLESAVAGAKEAVKANADAVDQMRSGTASAARGVRELEQRERDLLQAQRDSLARVREQIGGQQQLNEQTATYGQRLRDTARSMAAYVAGFLAIDAAVGAVRNGITAMLQAGDKTERLGNQMEAMMDSIKGGEQATAWIKGFAKTTPLAVADVTEAFAQLKTFGVDPMGGALQALVDQNEKLGGGQDRLLGLVTAVGQAWGKQKLQTEEILQLVERGVPAWDMLASVTGKNTAKLMEMAGAGQLGRDVISDLLDEMARGAGGAAADNMSTLTGLTSQLSDVWQGFLSKVADSGALDYAKGRLKALLDTVAQMDADGSLDAMAKRWSDRFVSLASSIEGAGQWVARHATELKALGAAYAAFKIAGMVSSMVEWGASVQRSSLQLRAMTTETNAATAATLRLSAAQKVSAAAQGGLAKVGGAAVTAGSAMLSIAGRMSIYATAAYMAADAGEALGNWLGKHSQAAKDAEAAIERNRQQMLAQYDQALQTAQGMQVVTDVQIKSTAELRKASDSEREGYRERLKAQEEYQKAQLKAAIYGKEAGKVTEEEYKKAAAALASTRKALAGIEPAAKAAADALNGNLTTGAMGLIERFNELKRSGKDVDEVLAELGKGFDPRNAEQLRDMGQTLQYLGQYGVLSGEQIQQFLTERLQKLSGEDLVRLQQVAQQVFAGMSRDSQALGLTMEASLNTALAKLGLDLEQISTGFDKGTRDVLDGFDQVIAQTAASGKSAEDSARIIVAAFQSAREKIDDPDALKQLEGAYKAWQGTSTEAATAARARMSELQAEAKESAKAINGMEDALSKVGEAANAMDLANIGVAASRAFHEGRMSAEQYAKVQEAIKAKYAELGAAAREAGQAAEEGAEQGSKSQQMYNKALEDSILTNEELRRISGQRMEEERRASGELMAMQRKGQVETQRDMSAMEGFFGGVLSRAREPLAAMSAAALAAYDRLRGVSSVSVGIDTSGLEATRASLRGVSDELAGVQMAQTELLSKSNTGFSKWMLGTQEASLRTQQAYLGQKASLQSLMERYENGTISLKSFIAAAKGAAGSLNLLDDSDLSSLESAIASAEQQMQALGDSTRNTLEGLQSELDQLQGREDAVEARRFSQRKRELQAQLEDARASGDSGAITNLSRAMQVLREIQTETEQQRIVKTQQERQQQQPAAAAAAQPAPPPATVIRLETTRGQRVDVSVPQGQQTQLLDILAEAGLRTT
ncbi:tape measure domain-containing protein [Pseudomonas linyingensis]|uniref:Tape measure domain-containing protein n=1 Tax=Pseudomonas linyingensis TaxID=915471 RepID=A0A1H6ZXC6_9PSED|nr:tape measure protein [Pseudomonas linyingensis]SEJ58001.1 tape measure domain-containing protein [Pseudomonas linyingensis]